MSMSLRAKAKNTMTLRITQRMHICSPVSEARNSATISYSRTTHQALQIPKHIKQKSQSVLYLPPNPALPAKLLINPPVDPTPYLAPHDKSEKAEVKSRKDWKV